LYQDTSSADLTRGQHWWCSWEVRESPEPGRRLGIRLPACSWEADREGPDFDNFSPLGFIRNTVRPEVRNRTRTRFTVRCSSVSRKKKAGKNLSRFVRSYASCSSKSRNGQGEGRSSFYAHGPCVVSELFYHINTQNRGAYGDGVSAVVICDSGTNFCSEKKKWVISPEILRFIEGSN